MINLRMTRKCSVEKKKKKIDYYNRELIKLRCLYSTLI